MTWKSLVKSNTIWQHAAGDTNRDYAEYCLRWDVILFGPGDAGSWPACKTALLNARWSRKISDLQRFAEQMKDGDLVVLRLGTSKVLGVGQIVGSYEYHDAFEDMDGWDLQHIRRVRWVWKGLTAPQIFSPYDMKLGDTTQCLAAQSIVRSWLASLPVTQADLSRNLVSLPNTEPVIEVNEISEFLFDHGVASASITHLLHEIDELIRIATWYQRSGKPSEHETVAYLVVSLLRALGWTPQRMVVEWKNVDVALFDRLPRSDDALSIVVEAKKMGRSCLAAMAQAMTYTNGKDGCHRFIVTDGLRYGIYTRASDNSFHLHAYLNLTRLKRDYPIYICKGAADALLAMAPEWTP